MGAIAGLLGGRALAWIVMSGGVLIVLSSIWAGAKHKGAIAENAKWEKSVAAQVRQNRDANFGVNNTTVFGNGNLQEEERRIREHWATIGRNAEKSAVVPELQPAPAAIGLKP